MGSIANISLKNYAVVEQVFTANQPEKGVTWYFNRTTGNSLGHVRCSTSLTMPPMNGSSIVDQNRIYKARFNIYLPTLENAGTTDGGYTAVPKRAYENIVKVEFQLPERGALAERRDLRSYLVDLFTETNVIDMIDNFNGTY